jgi:acid phosphatase family membrane protein YuiD
MKIAELHWMMEYPGEVNDLTERNIRRIMGHYAWEIVQTLAVFVFGAFVVALVV